MADENKIVITLDDVNNAASPPHPSPALASAGVTREWGTVASPGAGIPGHLGVAQKGNFFLQGWVYLGLAGLLGAFLAWAICEPNFVERGEGWGTIFMFPMMIALVCTGLGLAESLVERSTQKAIIRGTMALILGLVFGIIFQYMGNTILNKLLGFLREQGQSLRHDNPAMWFVRGIAWMVFGVSGGLVYGIVGRSMKMCLYGILGGLVGAGIGGFIFDPIGIVTGGGAISRLIGLSIFGASIGIAIGLVENALKDRWLYVSSGPLAGKQFILYKPMTVLGSQQSNDIYLFKDLAIQPQHATIEIRGAQAVLLSTGPTTVNGQPVMQHVLRNGDTVQIGRYVFNYQEKHQ